MSDIEDDDNPEEMDNLDDEIEDLGEEPEEEGGVEILEED